MKKEVVLVLVILTALIITVLQNSNFDIKRVISGSAIRAPDVSTNEVTLLKGFGLSDSEISTIKKLSIENKDRTGEFMLESARNKLQGFQRPMEIREVLAE